MVEENVRNDHISSLPDDILNLILSLLPIESALQTSFLSTQWRRLWNTDLVQHGTLKDIVSAIDGFLSQLYNVLDIDWLRQPRRLHFHINQSSVILATVGINNELFLNLSTGKQGNRRNFDWYLKPDIQDHMPSPCHSTFFVKHLHLTSVNYLTSDAISSIVSKFQFLVELKIEKCNGLTSLSFRSWRELQVLIVLDCSQLKSMELIDGRLQYFGYRGPWISFKPCFMNAAMLDINKGPDYRGFKYPDLLISTSDYVKILTLCKWIFEAFINHTIWVQPPCWLPTSTGSFKFCNLEELRWFDSSIGEDNIDSLLSFLRRCPILQRLFIHIDPTQYSMPSWAKCRNQLVAARPQLLDHLKMIKFEGFMSPEDEILLALCLLEVSTATPKIIATTHGNCPRILVRPSSCKKKQFNKKGDKKLVEPQGKQYSYRFVGVDELRT